MQPLGPAILSLKNRGEGRRRANEMTALGVPELGHVNTILSETEELCSVYERLHPEYAFHWQRAIELVKAHAQGTSVGLDVVRKWGFVKCKHRSVALPDWWEGQMIVPLEFMDYSPHKYLDEEVHNAGTAPDRFHALAKRASDRAWIGYYCAKGYLNSGNVSLLI